jgi:hypothetical protein
MSSQEDFIKMYHGVYPDGYCQHLINEFERLTQSGAGCNRQNGEGAARHAKDDMQLGLNISQLVICSSRVYNTATKIMPISFLY